jgi:hypothetical protein
LATILVLPTPPLPLVIEIARVAARVERDLPAVDGADAGRRALSEITLFIG